MENDNKNKDSCDPYHLAFYTSCISGWQNTRMEKDKSLLTLSSLGVGLLSTYTDKLESVFDLSIWFLATLSFVATIVIVLLIYKQNAVLLQLIFPKDKDAQAEELVNKSLAFKESLSNVSFILAILFTFLLFICGTDFTIVKGKI